MSSSSSSSSGLRLALVSLLLLSIMWLCYRAFGLRSTVAEPFSNAAVEATNPGNIWGVDNIVGVRRAVNTLGSSILEEGGDALQCRVSGVGVNDMETSHSRDQNVVSCTISRSLLKPLARRPLTNNAALDVPRLERLLRYGAATEAFCRPRSTVCTVAFMKNTPARRVREYNNYMTRTFGLSANNVANVTHSGTMFAMIPDAGGDGQVPQRMTIRIDDDGNKHFLVYKYSPAARESPLELWNSGGRHTDDDVALKPDDGSQAYCSTVVREASWRKFQFSYVLVEARRGPDIVCSYRFRAMQDPRGWFTAQNLVSARFGGIQAPDTFRERRFARFAMEDAQERLYWSIMDEVPDRTSCAQMTAFLTIPYRATRCPSYDRLNAKVVASDRLEPLKLSDVYAKGTSNLTTHLNVWLVVVPEGGGTHQARGGSPAAVASTTSNSSGAPMPPAPFQREPSKPSKTLACILSNRCGAVAPDWEAFVPKTGAYTQDALNDIVGDAKVPLIAVAKDAQDPALSTLTRIRFHKSYRVVVFGEGRDFSPDAYYVAVLHDLRIMRSYGIGAAGTHSSINNVRYADGRRGMIDLKEPPADDSFMEACLVKDFATSVRSIIVQDVVDVPVQASGRCGSDVFEIALHVGSYRGGGGQPDVDMCGNAFEPAQLRSLRIAKGYQLHAFDQPGFQGDNKVHKGPVSVCLDPATDAILSFRIVYEPDDDEGDDNEPNGPY